MRGYDKNGRRIVVGDLVTIDDGGIPSNYAGTAKVNEITIDDGETWFHVRAVDRLTGGWKKGDEWTFITHRVKFLGGDASVDRGPALGFDPPDASKPSNPKDAIGSDKMPLHLWPETATAMGCLGLLEGMLKYGRGNWRETGVRASIYVDALRRHVGAWFEGEDCAPDSGLPHLAHALACLAIIVDAEAAGNLVDDRQYPGGHREQLEALTPHVARLKAKYVDKDPKHWTIQDAS